MGKGSAVDPEEIQSYVETNYQRPVKAIKNSQEAVFEAVSERKDDDLVLVTGSLYLVGEARTLWKLPQF
jgi:folylpolyglutamate synthase/dihydropteroate synthase